MDWVVEISELSFEDKFGGGKRQPENESKDVRFYLSYRGSRVRRLLLQQMTCLDSEYAGAQRFNRCWRESFLKIYEPFRFSVERTRSASVTVASWEMDSRFRTDEYIAEGRVGEKEIEGERNKGYSRKADCCDHFIQQQYLLHRGRARQANNKQWHCLTSLERCNQCSGSGDH